MQDTINPFFLRFIYTLPHYKTGLGVDVSKALYFILNFKKERRILVSCGGINTISMRTHI